MPIIPPWLQTRPNDAAEAYTRGLSIGTGLAETRARLAAEGARSQMEAQARQAQLKRETLVEQQRINVQQARTQAEIGLRQQAVQLAQQKEAQRVHDAAMKAADEAGFAKDLSGGMSIEQALYRHPRLTTPTAAIAAHKDTLDRAGERLDLAKQRLELGQQDLERKAREFSDRQSASANKLQRIGEKKTLTPEGETTEYMFGTPGAMPKAGGGTPAVDENAMDDTQAGEPAAAAAVPQFKKGQKAKQGGVTYQFDGTSWNPVD